MSVCNEDEPTNLLIEGEFDSSLIFSRSQHLPTVVVSPRLSQSYKVANALPNDERSPGFKSNVR